MTSRPPAAPLPKPQHPAVAARAVSDAAHIAAYIWARPLDPARHGRAISQLYSTLRDLGIATRGLARYQMTDIPAGPVSPDFPQYVDASARWLLNTCESLDGVLAAEGTGSLPDPDEPGAVLCQAARNAILAWRLPSGTSTDRDMPAASLPGTPAALARAGIPDRGGRPAGQVAATAIAFAEAQLGKPYQWGAAGPEIGRAHV